MNSLETLSLNKKPIGIYDSGIGGLTVLKKLLEVMPNENFVYFADNINLPYGEKTQQQIINYSKSIMHWLEDKVQAKLIIAACHTSSSLALQQLEKDFLVKIIGTIYPIINHIIKNNRIEKIAIIATPASANSLMHEKILYDAGFKGKIKTISCPEFVKLVEAEQSNPLEIKKYCNEYLANLKEFSPDTLIYGCTHYPFLSNIIEKILPENVSYIDPGSFIAKEAKEFLKQDNSSTDKGSIQFYCSRKDKNLFERQIQRLMNNRDLITTYFNPH